MSLRLSQIVNDLDGLSLIGKDVEVFGFSKTNNRFSDRILWIRKLEFVKDILTNCVLLTEDKKVVESLGSNNSILLCESNSRFYVSLINSRYFLESDPSGVNKAESWREKGYDIGNFVFISEETDLGKGTIVGHNTSILGKVSIGEKCKILANSVIGEKGLGLEWTGEEYIEFPQIGEVIIGSNCSIGPLSAIRRGALVDTVIGDQVQIGSLCNIGHNVQIGDGALLTSCVCISGSAIIGSRAFIGVGATIKNKVRVGANVTVGQGAVVVSNVENGITVAGNPANQI